MVDIEESWPPEMLAEVFPEQYGHLVFDWAVEETDALPSCTVERLQGGCVVIGLPGAQEAWRAAHRSSKRTAK